MMQSELIVNKTVAFRTVEKNVVMIVRGKLVNWDKESAKLWHATEDKSSKDLSVRPHWFDVFITHINGSSNNPKYKSVVGKTFRHEGPILGVVDSE